MDPSASLLARAGLAHFKLTRAPGKSPCREGGPEALGKAGSVGPTLLPDHPPLSVSLPALPPSQRGNNRKSTDAVYHILRTLYTHI